MKRAASSLLAISVVGCCALDAHAQSTDDGSAPPRASVAVVYSGAVFSNVDGGIQRGETYNGTVDLQVTLDGKALFGMRGVTVYFDGLWIHGAQPSALMGDAQGVNNLAAPTKLTLNEAWLQFDVLDNRVSALVGRFDTNAEFYRVQSAGLFINSSFGMGPDVASSGAAGPSIFPSTSVGTRLAYKPASNIVLRAAILDGVPVDRPGGRVGVFQRGDGLLLLSEVAFLNRAASGDRRGTVRFRIGRASGLPPYDSKLAVGTWYYTASFNDLNKLDSDGEPIRHRGSGGVYAVGDVRLWHSRTDPSQRVTGFVEGGLGDGRVNRFGSYLGAGMVATRPLSKRPTDELGVAIAIARNGPAYLDHQRGISMTTTRTETAFEVTYLAQIASWLALQPDFQYVIHPNTDLSVHNGLAFQVRFEMAF